MSQIAVRAAFETALAALTPAIATDFENANFVKPGPSTPYQSVKLLFAKPENPEMGTGYRELGYMQVTLFYPLGVGTLVAATRAKLLRDTFVKNTSLTNSGVVVTVNATPEIATGSPDDDRWMIPVKVPFHANLFS